MSDKQVADEVPIFVYFPTLLSPPFETLPSDSATGDIGRHVSRRGARLASASYRMF